MINGVINSLGVLNKSRAGWIVEFNEDEYTVEG